jgi:hypothetical protein
MSNNKVYSLLKRITLLEDAIGFGNGHQLPYRRTGDAHNPVFPDRVQNNLATSIARKDVGMFIKEYNIQMFLISYLLMILGIKFHGVLKIITRVLMDVILQIHNRMYRWRVVKLYHELTGKKILFTHFFESHTDGHGIFFNSFLVIDRELRSNEDFLNLQGKKIMLLKSFCSIIEY